MLVGTMINLLVFVFMPILKNIKEEEEVLVLELKSWQPVTKEPQKKVTPVKKPKPLPPKIKKKVVKKPPVEKTPPPKDETPSPDKLAKAEPKPETQAVEEDVIPIPTPIFQLTELAQFVHKAELNYPEDMYRLGKEAVVKVDVLIDSRGRVRKVTINQSAGESFDQAAIDAINRSSFTPARKKGKPVAMVLRLPIKFSLR